PGPAHRHRGGLSLGARARVRLLRTPRRPRPAPCDRGGEIARAQPRGGVRRRVAAGECAVAVGSRFVPGNGNEPYRYRPSPARRLGTGLLRRSVGVVLRRPFGDAKSGLSAGNAKALPFLAEPYTSGAPEVEALIRVVDAGLRLEEVP